MNHLKMLRNNIFYLVIVTLLSACSQKAGVKLHNSTDQPIEISGVFVNQENVLALPLKIPQRTSQRYSPIGDINAWVESGDVLSVEVIGKSQKTLATCVVPKQEPGVCLLKVHFEGTAILRCGYDCYDGDPFT